MWPDQHLRGVDGQPVPFHYAQVLAWNSTARTIVISAGAQSGKTSWEPWWLWREIQRHGLGDYIAATSSYALFTRKFLPEFLAVFCDVLGMGRYWAQDRVIELRNPTTGRFSAKRSADRMWGRIILGSAQASNALESATAKAAVLDEVGQDEFTLRAYQAIRRRLHIHEGRVLMATTLYSLGWFAQQIVRPTLGAEYAQRTAHYDRGGEVESVFDPETDTHLIQFDSIVNPVFSQAEYERARDIMPPDDFDLFYRGRLARPRTMIFDCYNEETHVTMDRPIPKAWPTIVGIDPVGERVAALAAAWDPQAEQLHVYYEYYEPFGETTPGHVRNIREHLAHQRVVLWVGGGPSERQQRVDWADAGIPLQRPPVGDVWVTIGYIYEMLTEHALVIHKGCENLRDEIARYQRKKDSDGEPTKDILDKESFHLIDCLRYLASWLMAPGGDTEVVYDRRRFLRQ